MYAVYVSAQILVTQLTFIRAMAKFIKIQVTGTMGQQRQPLVFKIKCQKELPEQIQRWQFWTHFVRKLICHGHEWGLDSQPPTMRPKQRLGWTSDAPHFSPAGGETVVGR